MSTKGCQLNWKTTNALAIVGDVDEYADFSPLAQSAGQTLYIDFSGVTRLNSAGLRTWIQTILRHQIQLVLRDCSPVVMEQLAMIPEFVGKSGQVESFFARYMCVSCSHEEKARYQLGQNLSLESPRLDLELKHPCPVCGDSLELDQTPEVYLSFLRYRSKTEPAAS